jgi:hypothetical protein
MDVYGKEHTAPEGEYFRNNVWWWRPLANYILEVGGEVAAKCEHWHSNSGDGLSAVDARRLADILEAEIASGDTASYEKAYTAELQGTPDEACDLCGGTGKRRAPPDSGPGDQPCNKCDGKGHVRPFETHYPFSVENVAAFAKFARASGGFEIC